MSGWIRDAGRGLGVTAGAANAAAWAFAMWVPTSDVALTAGGEPVGQAATLAVGFLMCVTSIVAVIAAARGHGGVLLGAFLVSFLPVGAFLLYADHWLYWTGWSDLALLASAAMIRLGPRAPAASPREDHG